MISPRGVCFTTVSATKIGASSPTDLGVVHTGIEYVVKLSQNFVMKNAIITANHAIKDIAHREGTTNKVFDSGRITIRQ